MRAAILGLYNSGSSVISEIAERLGADIGRPLWGPFFESYKLKQKLVSWWNEPALVESIPRADRIAYLKLWANYHEASSKVVCAKHPLLCLSAQDLEIAWGHDYKAIRAFRPLETSIERLQARGWFAEPERMQKTLFRACEEYFDRKEHLVIEYEDLLANPQENTLRIAEYLCLDTSDERIAKAAAAVRS